MTVTLTSNYRDTLAPETVALIDKFQEGNYFIEDMLVFIDEYSEEAFQDHYEQYVELGEDYGFEAVDAWIRHTDPYDLKSFEEAYIGEFLDPRNMAEDYLEEESRVADIRLCIDWQETAEYLLAHEVDRIGDFYFRCSY